MPLRLQTPAPAPAPAPGGLLRWDEVPPDFVECFILSGYRRRPDSLRQCLATLLQPTNETLNFWTHFVPLLLFLARFARLLLLGGGGRPGQPPPRALAPALLPLWCYASGVLLTLAVSCAAHLCSCLAPRRRAALFYLDYASISYYGFASTLAYHHYLLPGLRLLDAAALDPLVQARLGWRVDCARLLAAYRALVLPVGFALAVACTVACCRSRSARCAHPFALRTFVFALPLSMACPIALEGLLFDLRLRDPALLARFVRRYLWLGLAAFFNVSKLPERAWPGRFDIVGHSHQLFHVFTALGIYEQVCYVEDALGRSLDTAAPTLPGTVGYMALLALCLGLVVRRFLAGSDPVAKRD
ncbi:membrane progestin receptor epsilon [Ornithorhynchus anatinus]|uniref:membrane progestin receptor epsilon n=1 Tax=Ornithorhynchus anatinus TaxID=9258 RepID=UPI0010A8D212|nr:membrane progestin receptor epsilon [Ornithorhynchus anatinus]